MAATTTTKSFLFKQHSSMLKADSFSSNSLFVIPTLSKPSSTTAATLQTSHKKLITKASATAKKETISDERVQQVHSTEEFDVALQTAKNKLVVVLFTATHSNYSREIYRLMVDLSRTCNNVVFVLVMVDESDKTKAICERQKIERVPHFSFYKSREKIHEEEGIIGPDELMRDISYYGDNHSAVVRLHSRKDFENLVEEHKIDNKLIVLNIGSKHCEPCIKVYPTVLVLSRQMVDTVVFARMDGAENESCMQFSKDMKVVEVPTFLFIRDGDICGRYVGSDKVKLMDEIVRYQKS
ncbi:hypothetical protein C5167_025417 [Papaver somniferum]|uniref:Thioredoxin domain-containing protein n=1 Tax=Papaver somniferum TaxID=3469 RepID=A0A4Y7JSH9_PAPSO|nr:thioredoxin-like protein CDSP32, chloroplastic [Papaver somniferum]RZC63677.1 hypothetical protein C5167_025417 [Papaver somniferum]